MGLRIATNTASLATQRALEGSSQGQKKLYTRLSSGARITSAADDAAGLSISENMRAQLMSGKQAERNAQNAISFVQVAEGGLNEIANSMIRLRELAIQAASDTVGDRERGFINEEFKELKKEVDRIANSTTFNGINLLNGSHKNDNLQFQVGINNSEADRILYNVNDADVRASSLGVDDINTTTIDDALDSLAKVDEGLARVNSNRARLGAIQNKMHATVRSVQIQNENLANAKSRIADADIAQVTSELVQANILQSAGIAVLSQANAGPMQALKLL